MTVSRRIFVAGAAGLVLVLAAPLIAAEGLYRYALHELGEPPPTAAPDASPSLVVTAFWVDAGERLPFAVEPLSPWRFGWALAFDRNSLSKRSSGERVASLAARAWLAERPRPPRARWPLMSWAATVWASRHWDAAQMTQVWMDGAWYGRDARGRAMAAAAYFDKTPGDLALHETAFLVALTRSPSSLDPACAPERARSARDRVLGELLSAGAISRPDHELAVAQPLRVVPRVCE